MSKIKIAIFGVIVGGGIISILNKMEIVSEIVYLLIKNVSKKEILIYLNLLL